MKQWIFVTALVFVLSPATPNAHAADKSRKPNIVYIVADDLGYADIGAQEISKDVKSPNTDAIAAAGVRFTNGYVSCPVCSPTRAGLMTGRYQERFGYEVNPGPGNEDKFGLPLDQVTLPQTLKAAGYVTGMVGKWHLGFKLEMLPTNRGFDEFFGFLGGAHPYNVLGKGNNVMMRNDKPIDSVEYLTDAFAKESVAFIEKHAKDEKPFFLYLAFNAVHTPQEAPQKYMDRFADEKDPVRKSMLAMLSAMDDAVGQVQAAVAKSGHADNTLIIYHADNGGPTPSNGSRNTPLHGFKAQVYEGGIRIPFMMQWQGHLPAGKVYDKPVISLDMFPTILAAAGIEVPKDVKFDGVNLLPHLTGNAVETDPPHKELFWRYGRQWAIRSGNYKLLKPPGDGSVELYDLSSDVAEKINLAADKPDVLKQLQASYDAWASTLEKPRWNDARMENKQGEGKGKGKGKGRGKNAANPA